MFLAQTTGAQVADAAPHLLGKLIDSDIAPFSISRLSRPEINFRANS